MKRALLAALLLGGLALGTVDPETPAEEFPSTVKLLRDDKTITAVKYGPNDKGMFVICTPSNDDKEQVTRSVIYDADPYFVHITIDKNVIKTRVAVVRQQENGDGEIEAYNGSADFRAEDDPECFPIVKPDPKPNTVFVEQGKTKLVGQRLKYTEDTGLAVIDGPITFERPQDKGETLRGNSDKITVDVDNEKTFLEGGVTLRSKCRTSTADRVEYDDRANRAILFGKPAVSSSVDGKDSIKGERLEYDLDTNDVVVTAASDGVTGQFEDDAPPCR